MTYEPPYLDQYVESIARKRGIVADDELISDALARTCRALAEIDARLEPEHLPSSGDTFAAALDDGMRSGRILPSSQILAAAGRAAGGAACTVINVAGTSDAAKLQRLLVDAAYASELGMGIGIDVSDFQDPVAALVAINDAVRTVGARLTAECLRPPAVMISCSSRHPCVAKFIRAKWDANFTQWVANISVRVEGDASEWSQLRGRLAEAAHRNGEPGVLFQAVADADNPTPQLRFESTAPCAEVFLSPGERCVFVSTNAAAHVSGGAFDWELFERSITLAVRAAEDAVELAAEGAPPIVAERRRVGVGIVGWHSALIQLGMPYAASGGLARAVAERLTYAAHRASAELAVRRGAFPLWHGSRWQDPAWVRRKESRRAGAVDRCAWNELEAQILRTGVRNAAIVAYPPTGVVAGLLGVSRSYEPHYSLVGRTGVASSAPVELVPEVAAALAADATGDAQANRILCSARDYQLPDAGPEHLLACARQLPPSVHLEVHEAFSGFADEAGSKTINLPGSSTVDQVEAMFDRARLAGLKGVTVFREGCLSETHYLTDHQ